MAETFEIGEVVHLKSGGPEMTITKVGLAPISQQTILLCAWFEGNKQMEGEFPQEAVEREIGRDLPRTSAA
jgi:uncharacterized protein YodC (DUF2158 family)